MYVHPFMKRFHTRKCWFGGHPFMERFPISTMGCCPEYKVAQGVTANSHRIREMEIKSIALLLLCLTMEEMMGLGKHKCRTTVLDNCINNPRITISKTKQNYRLRLCSNDQCIPDARDNMNLNWIKCNDVCKACPLLLSETG